MSQQPAPNDPQAWQSLLSQELIQAAFHSGGELAWTKDGAIKAIEVLESSGQTIIGVDTWIVRDDAPTPVVFDWDQRKAGQDPRFPATPVEFVRQFTWDIIPQDESSDPYFNLTVARL